MKRALLLGVFVLTVATPLCADEPGVAATVNGVPITVFRLERHFEDFLKERGRNLAAIRHPDVYKRLKREALDELIDRELLAQEAERRGLEVPQADLDAVLARIAATSTGPEAHARRLAAAGFDDASYADYVRRSLAAQRAFQSLLDEARRAGGTPAAEPRALANAVRARLRDGAKVERLLPL